MIVPLPEVPDIPEALRTAGWRILVCPLTNAVNRPVPAGNAARVWPGVAVLQVPARAENRIFRMIEGPARVELGIELVRSEPGTHPPATFDPPATLTMSFARCPDAQVPENREYAILFYGTMPGGTGPEWHQLSGTVRWAERTIEVPVTHLSRFVIATRAPAGGQ